MVEREVSELALFLICSLTRALEKCTIMSTDLTLSLLWCKLHLRLNFILDPEGSLAQVATINLSPHVCLPCCSFSGSGRVESLDGFAPFVQRVGDDKHMVSLCSLGEGPSTSGLIFCLICSFHKYVHWHNVHSLLAIVNTTLWNRRTLFVCTKASLLKLSV